ncbi:MAG: GNAT family N-acetyltransferase [Neomegalonema sp.]|nr:GNAT family N-acetyltransferase [Neomegalonema sp.]
MTFEAMRGEWGRTAAPAANDVAAAGQCAREAAAETPGEAADASPVTVEWVDQDQAIEQLVDEWRRERQRFDAISFQQDLERLSLERAHRGLNVRFLVARDARGRIVGYANLAPVDTKMAVSFGLKTLARVAVARYRAIGGDFPIARDADEAQVLAAMAAHLERDERALVTVEECAESSRLSRNAAALRPFALKSLDRDPQVIHTIDLPESFDAYMKLHKGKTRNTLKRRVRVFGESFEGGARLVRYDRADQVEEFVAAVGAIFQKSWKRGVLSEAPPVTEADIPYLTALAERGVLRSYVLYGGDEPICCSLMTQTGGVCDFLDVLYAQEHGRLAPGQVLILQTIEDFYAERDAAPRPVEFNFGYGENAYKRVFGTRSYPANYCFMARPYTKAAFVVSCQLALRSVYHLARKAVVALELDHKLRKLLKRGGSS